MKRLILQITALVIILSVGALAVAVAQQERSPSGPKAVAATGSLGPAPSPSRKSTEAIRPGMQRQAPPAPLKQTDIVPVAYDESAENHAAPPSVGTSRNSTGDHSSQDRSPQSSSDSKPPWVSQPSRPDSTPAAFLRSLLPGQSGSSQPAVQNHQPEMTEPHREPPVSNQAPIPSPSSSPASNEIRFSASAAQPPEQASLSTSTEQPPPQPEPSLATAEAGIRPDSRDTTIPKPLSQSPEPTRVIGHESIGNNVPSPEIRRPSADRFGDALPESAEAKNHQGPGSSEDLGSTGSTAAAPQPGGVRGNGLPGDASMEGPQSPQIVIEKVIPPEIQLGNPTSLKILIRNVGTVTAQDVVLRDQIPHGTRLIKTVPESKRSPSGEIIWQLGDLSAAQETMALMELVPESEGEIGSVAKAMFTVSASARTRVTKPELALEMTIPEQPHLHKDITFNITISNPGSGTARNVVLEEQVPDALEHPAGKELLYKVGDLKPNETKELTLTMHCAKPGKLTNHLIARADGHLMTESHVPLEILAPQLDVAIEGPRRRFLERQAEYELLIRNTGTAAAYNVDLVAHLPEGLQFEKTNNNGYYESSSHTVHWALEELPKEQTGSVKLVTLPITSGEHEIRFTSVAEGNLQAEAKQEVFIDGIPAVYFEVADRYDPVEVGGEASYEVRLVNEGTKVARNVTLMIQLSPGTEFLSADGPTKEQIDGGTIQFAPIAELMPKEKQLYQVNIKCLTDGDHRFRVQVISDDMQSPVTKEENTRVFADQ